MLSVNKNNSTSQAKNDALHLLAFSDQQPKEQKGKNEIYKETKRKAKEKLLLWRLYRLAFLLEQLFKPFIQSNANH